MIGLMDGQLTVDQLWNKTIERFGDDAPTQGDMVRLLSQLHSSDMLLCNMPPDTLELLNRSRKIRENKVKMYLFSPLSWRFPLFDPDRFLSRTIPLLAPLFSVLGILIWTAAVVTALVLVGRHWGELSQDVVDRILSAQNLFLMWLVYPVVKLLHEFGHAYTTKKWGGEVHEMGVMLLGLMPVPYVDASAASAFREKGRRIAVSSAGMLVELFVSAIAFFIWLTIAPGTVRSVAYNIMMIGGISTVLFNGNPLLRYDGYYIFADLLGIPNLAQKSNDYLIYLVKRYFFRLKQLEAPHVAPGRHLLLGSYAIASFIYRFFVYAAIILFISGKFFIIGIILAIWAAVSMLVFPLVKGLKYLFFSPQLHENRVRSVTVVALTIAGLAVLIFLVPFPSWTRTEGVVWVPEEAIVRAKTGGFVKTIVACPDSVVKKGDLLIECADPQHVMDRTIQRAQLKLLEAQYQAEITNDRTKAKITMEEMVPVRANLARAEEKVEELIIRSPGNGHFVVPGAEDLPERYVKEGDLIAYVLEDGKPIVRVVVYQSDVDLIRRRNFGVQIRFAENPERTFPASIKRLVPGAVQNLPSNVLSSAGGGKVAIDPSDRQGLKSLEKMFQVDVELPSVVTNANIGGRVYVRFNHGFEPLSVQWYRSLRRLFLRHFNV